MPIKLNIGLSRKVGESNYGSRGASINLEVELDNGVLNNPGQLRDRVHDLYVLARQCVDEELQRPADAGPSEPSHVNGNEHGRTNGHSNGNGHANGQVANGNGHSNGHASISNGHSNGHSNEHSGGQHNRVQVARATSSQIRAIFAITKRQGLDPHQVINDRFRVHKMEELTIREASSLIDELKSGAGVRS